MRRTAPLVFSSTILILGIIFGMIFLPIKTYKSINADKLYNWVNTDQNITIVDARDFQTYIKSHIDRAIWFNASNPDTILIKLPENHSERIISYCDCLDGRAAIYVLKIIEKWDYTNLFYLKGNFSKIWIYPVVSGNTSIIF